jgi:putative aldouronate transport system permease protein
MKKNPSIDCSNSSVEKRVARTQISLFGLTNGLVLCVLCAVFLLPFVHLLAKSLSTPEAVIRGEVALLPIGFQLETYRFVLGNHQFRTSFMISVFLAIVGTGVSVLLTVMVAYPLSKRHFKGRKFFLSAFVISWLLAPSIVPVFFLIKSLGLMNNLLSVILIDAVYCFNMLIVKTYFEGMPESLSEAAQIEGASNARILFSIIVPLSMPVIATIAVYSVFGYWNMYFHPMLFLSKPELKPLQVYIYELVYMALGNNSASLADRASMGTTSVPDVIRSATVFVSIIPVMAVYPFVQRHFVKGMLIGSVKG